MSITSLGMLYCGFLGRIRSLISPLCDITSFLPHSSDCACIPPKKITILHSNWSRETVSDSLPVFLLTRSSVKIWFRGRRCFRSSCLNLARWICAIMAILATSSNYCNIWCLLTLRIWHKEYGQHSFEQWPLIFAILSLYTSTVDFKSGCGQPSEFQLFLNKITNIFVHRLSFSDAQN